MPWSRWVPRLLVRGSLLAGLLAVAACSKQAQPAVRFGPTVRGKVTYQGEPVSYGFVLFFSLDAGPDPKTGMMAPAASAPLSKDGSYEAPNVPLGRVVVCVATDPDVLPLDLLRPRLLGGGPEMLGGRTGPGGFHGGPPGGPHQGPPGLPPEPPAPPSGKDKGPVGPPPGIPKPGSNPATKDFPEELKKTLKEIHKKYGAFGRSSLAQEITEATSTLDLKLK